MTRTHLAPACMTQGAATVALLAVLAAAPALSADATSPQKGARPRIDAGAQPLPWHGLFAGSGDLTFNPPAANPLNNADPLVALSRRDGWSTSAPWTIPLSASIDATAIRPGENLRIYQTTGALGNITGLSDELRPNVDYSVTLAASDAESRTLRVNPLRPLQPRSTYLVVASSAFQTAVPAPPANARTGAVLAWTVTITSAVETFDAIRNRNIPVSLATSTTGLTTAALGLPPVADIYNGRLTLPYYSEVTPLTAVLTSSWQAAPGAYVAPFNALGLDPASTNLTFANPGPALRTNVTVPLLLTLPNAASGRTRPAGGWPVVIFGHGFTRNRLDALAVSATLASAGMAVVAMDLPLHGIRPGQPFHSATTAFAGLTTERTFEVDLVNNATGTAGPDGVVDESGTHFLNLASLPTFRDNLRQSVADLAFLYRALPAIDTDADGGADLDVNNVSYLGQSLGAIVGVPLLAIEPGIRAAALNTGAGGIICTLESSATFGPRIRAALAASGLGAGSSAFDSFLLIAQTVIDDADPFSHVAALGNRPILLQMVEADQVVPNSRSGQPLCGTEPLARALQLQTLTDSVTGNPVRAWVRFVQGGNSSLLSPGPDPAVTIEMQAQVSSFLASGGTAVTVQNRNLIRTSP